MASLFVCLRHTYSWKQFIAMDHMWHFHPYKWGWWCPLGMKRDPLISNYFAGIWWMNICVQKCHVWSTTTRLCVSTAACQILGHLCTFMTFSSFVGATFSSFVGHNLKVRHNAHLFFHHTQTHTQCWNYYTHCTTGVTCKNTTVITLSSFIAITVRKSVVVYVTGPNIIIALEIYDSVLLENVFKCGNSILINIYHKNVKLAFIKKTGGKQTL